MVEEDIRIWRSVWEGVGLAYDVGIRLAWIKRL